MNTALKEKGSLKKKRRITEVLFVFHFHIKGADQEKY